MNGVRTMYQRLGIWSLISVFCASLFEGRASLVSYDLRGSPSVSVIIGYRFNGQCGDTKGKHFHEAERGRERWTLPTDNRHQVQTSYPAYVKGYMWTIVQCLSPFDTTPFVALIRAEDSESQSPRVPSESIFKGCSFDWQSGSQLWRISLYLWGFFGHVFSWKAYASLAVNLFLKT